MDVDQTILIGVNFLKKNKLGDAKKIFLHLSKLEPANAEINHFLGITFQLLKQWNEAIICFEKTIKIKPNFAEAHKNLGNIFYTLGKINEAEQCYKKSINLNPQLEEAKTNLEIVLEQKKVVDWINQNEQPKKETQRKIIADPFITKRKVEHDLLDQIYNIQTLELDKTNDIRFGNGRCSSTMKLFEKKNKIIELVADDLTNIIKKEFRSEIYIKESFFNILQANSGTKPHKHLDPFDKVAGLDKQKYSLTYYISTGDQSSKEPGILKLYNPNEEILPSEGTLVIIPSNRAHSSNYDGKKDRVMIGANFYILN